MVHYEFSAILSQETISRRLPLYHIHVFMIFWFVPFRTNHVAMCAVRLRGCAQTLLQAGPIMRICCSWTGTCLRCYSKVALHQRKSLKKQALFSFGLPWQCFIA
ncbi:hypothetical protein COOONC_16296 [Cooperia oncophora]